MTGKLIKVGIAIAVLLWWERRGSKGAGGEGGVGIGIEVCSKETGKCASGESPAGESEGSELADNM